MQGSDVLFIIQLIGTVIFAVAQSTRMLTTVQGISPVWLVSAELFCIINLYLICKSNHQNSGRATKQYIITSIARVVALGLIITILILQAKQIFWGWYDTLTLIIISITVITTLCVIPSWNLHLTDPLVKGIFGALLRGIPHICMAYKVWLLGGNGLAPLTMWSGLVLAMIRWGQIYYSIKQDGFDRNKQGLVISEGTSETTWTIVIIVWAYRYY